MDPNSQNQTWSKWVWFVQPGTITQRNFKDVVNNCARFGRKGFGSASQMRVRKTGRGYIIEVLTERHPVNDPQYVEYMRSCWERFFTVAFGVGTKVKMTAKLMAGKREDGQPPDQLIVLPKMEIPNG